MRSIDLSNAENGRFFFLIHNPIWVANLKVSGIYTSTIGSFPLDDSVVNRKRCLDDLMDVGIDLPTYPQLSDMGKQFLDELSQNDAEIIFKKGRYTLRRQEIKQDVSPPGLEPFFWTIRYLEEKGIREKISLKAAITGPYTLASYIETGTGIFPFNTAASDPELVRQFARILSKSCEKVSRDAKMISIDEPVIGLIVGTRTPIPGLEENIIKTYDNLRKSCGDRFVGTHICGRISPRLASILLRTKLDFLSHEFHDTPSNIEIYAPEELEESGKVLSVGCVSSRNPGLESLEEILTVMESFRKYGDNLILTPDCGFKQLVIDGSNEKGYEISIRKLRNMVEAAKQFKAAR